MLEMCLVYTINRSNFVIRSQSEKIKTTMVHYSRLAIIYTFTQPRILQALSVPVNAQNHDTLSRNLMSFKGNCRLLLR